VAGDRMPFYRTDRREFITLLGGAAVLPLARAANGSSSTDWCVGSHTPQRLIVKARIALSAFRDTLQRLGLTDGRNVSIDARWGAGDPDRIRSYSKPVATSSGLTATAALIRRADISVCDGTHKGATRVISSRRC
jgi:hypothetical protein